MRGYVVTSAAAAARAPQNHETKESALTTAQAFCYSAGHSFEPKQFSAIFAILHRREGTRLDADDSSLVSNTPGRGYPAASSRLVDSCKLFEVTLGRSGLRNVSNPRFRCSHQKSAKLTSRRFLQIFRGRAWSFWTEKRLQPPSALENN